MTKPLSASDLTELIERLQYYNDLSPEQRTLFPRDIACQPCNEGNQLFAILRNGKPVESEITQFYEHVRQCTACQAFLRHMWRATGRNGY